MSYALTSRLVEKAFPAGALNGSVTYVPALVTLFAITAWVTATNGRFAFPFAIASALFVVSLALRTVDHAACGVFPIGTHFLWHLLNSGVLFALGAGLAAFAHRQRRRSRSVRY